MKGICTCICTCVCTCVMYIVCITICTYSYIHVPYTYYTCALYTLIHAIIAKSVSTRPSDCIHYTCIHDCIHYTCIQKAIAIWLLIKVPYKCYSHISYSMKPVLLHDIGFMLSSLHTHIHYTCIYIYTIYTYIQYIQYTIHMYIYMHIYTYTHIHTHIRQELRCAQSKLLGLAIIERLHYRYIEKARPYINPFTHP